MTIKSIIIDCDAGIDDALALIVLLVAHKAKKIKIKAITCVNGNTSVDNVVKNVFRTLQVCNAIDIPVFRGAYSALLPTKDTENIIYYHGKDGFGDVYTEIPDISKLQEEHAVSALHRIVSQDPGNITIICLGPLTNIALTNKLYPNFIGNVKEFYVMGGNSTAQGNVTAQAEFNFYMDPESVHIVLNDIKQPFWLLPWETCLKCRVTHEWREDVFGKLDKPCVWFMNKLEGGKCGEYIKEFPLYICCDALLAGILLRPDMVTDVVPYHASIELNGNKTRGQVILDRLSANKPNISLIQDFDTDIFKELLLSSVHAFDNNC